MSRRPLHIDTLEFGFHVGIGCPDVMPTAAQHNEIELNYILKGRMLLRRGSEIIQLDPGEGAIYWAAVPHQVLEVSPSTQLVWLVLPLSWLLSWRLQDQFNQRILSGGILPLSRTVGERVADLSRDFAKSGELDYVIKLEIEALFRRLALDKSLQTIASPLATREVQTCQQTEKLVSAMTQQFREPVTVAAIAKTVGLHPEYAMRLFRHQWGITMWTFLLSQRIAEARRLLVFSELPVTDIAFASGFQSLGRFYHSFRKQCGCTPLQYRRKHQQALSPEKSIHSKQR